MSVALVHTQSAYATGVTRYARSLHAALLEIGEDARLVSLQRRELRVAGRAVGGLVSLWAARATRRGRLADVVHATDPAVATPATDVVTIHDLIAEDARWGAKGLAERVDWALARRMSRRAPWLVTVSEATRQDVLRRWRSDPDRVVAVPSGIDHEAFRPVAERSPLLAEGKPTLVYVGDDHPRKNVLLAVRAVGRLGRPARLVRVGPSRFPEVARACRDEAQRAGVDLVEPGFLDDKAMVALLSHADAFLWPSLAEGFGFPPLEAMACGAPVVALDTPVNREVCGPLASYHADDADAAARAIRATIESPPPRDRVLAHARGFTWERAARGTAAVYARVREGRR